MNRYTVSCTGDARTTLAAMHEAGKTLFRGRERILPILNTVLTCVLVPAGGIVLVIALRTMAGLAPFPGSTVAMAATGGGFVLLSWWLSRRTYLVIARSSARAAMGRAVTATLDADGLRLQGGRSDWFTAWGDIDAVIGRPAFIGFVVGGIVLPIPTTAFADAGAAGRALRDCRDWHAAAAGAA